MDWSSPETRERMRKSREEMWREDTIPLLAQWIGFEPGQVVVDVGCGTGYLGQLFRPWIKESIYLGIDSDPVLVADGIEGDGLFYRQGDAYALPLDDDSADVVICCVLLTHLTEPLRAVREMMRVARPGGVVVAIEPDNLAAISVVVTAEQLALEHEEYMKRVQAGFGDMATGRQLCSLFTGAGLRDVDVRLNDRAHPTSPYQLRPIYLAKGRK